MINPIGSLGSPFPFGAGSRLTAMTAGRIFSGHQTEIASSLHKLSTGYRINTASDDPAGLITSENLRAVLAALDAETRSLQRADHVAATADAALGEVSSMLNEAEALVVANAGDGLSDEERAANQMQIDSIMSSINRIAGTTTFNGESLLDGTATLEAAGESLALESVAMGPIGEGADAQTAIAAARTKVTTMRGELGSFSRYTIQSQLTAKTIAIENVAAAESAIRDTDYAAETAKLSQLGVLSQASLGVLRIVNGGAGGVLGLVG